MKNNRLKRLDILMYIIAIFMVLIVVFNLDRNFIYVLGTCFFLVMALKAWLVWKNSK